MSGGSFNYLYCRNSSDLLESTEDLEKMQQYLIEHNYDDIAKDTRRLIEYVKSSKICIETLQDMLKDVFKAAEWYSDGDWGKATLDEAVEEYRNKNLSALSDRPTTSNRVIRSFPLDPL